MIASGESVERILSETELANDPPADEVLLDDALGVLGGDVPVPRSFRVHDADRAGGADAQALADLLPIVDAVSADAAADAAADAVANAANAAADAAANAASPGDL